MIISLKELEALRFIKNKIIYNGVSPSVRDIAKALGYRSPRSAALILAKLTALGIIGRKHDGNLKLLKDHEPNRGSAYTINIPLVGTAPCGAPLLAEENIEGFVSISKELAKPPYKYFLVRAEGDSMNQADIKDGDLVLCRQQETAQNGDRVVALIDDEATIKEFHHAGDVVMLRPKSKNKKHKPIIMSRNFRVQGVVVAAIKK
ncbi:MAG: transcriptional repressor LexA [Patescibacteria group bacterium]